MRMPRRMLAWVCFLAIASVAPGCGHRMQPTALLNRPPEIRLDPAPDVPVATAEGFSHRVAWSATDPDGRVDHYLVAANPERTDGPTSDWARTEDRSRVISSRRIEPGTLRHSDRVDREFELVGVRAVDDRGAVSEPAWRAFFGDNVAPTVRIVSPPPNPSLMETPVPPTFRVTWSGSDPDAKKQRPLLYKYKALSSDSSDFPLAYVGWDPDSLRRLYAPAFTGWDSVPGESTGVWLRDLRPGRRYLVAVTALDARGAYDPVFRLDKNLLLVSVLQPRPPRFAIFDDFTDPHEPYTSGGSPIDEPALRFTLPGPGPVTIHWIARSGYGSEVDSVSVRTMIDPHGSVAPTWSVWGAEVGEVGVGPFPHDPSTAHHQLYLEARDIYGLSKLDSVELEIVSPTFTHELLIVDDTRLAPDQRVPGARDSVAAPIGLWPSASELDTFLYARGGVPWRMRPMGTASPRGIFVGYSFDTIGTIPFNPPPSLAFLGRYKHVIWIVDSPSSFVKDYSSTSSATALRFMSYPGHLNTLAGYVEQGGNLWVLGGGVANATLAAWNNPLNDVGGRVYSSSGQHPDLVSPRFMTDQAEWRSELRVLGTSPVAINRSIPVGRKGTEMYARLPSALELRSPATDPVPPLRTATSFYAPARGLEVLTAPNHIDDPKNPSPRHQADAQALDTLYVARSSEIPTRSVTADDAGLNPCMTYYHGPEHGSVIFSGFDLWSFKREQCVQLVDAVLQDLWGLSKSQPVATGAVSKRRE
jgi:hypothetical protein